MDSWINRSGGYLYRNIWILTLKRIYAEGLQQIRRKEIGFWKEGVLMFLDLKGGVLEIKNL